LDKLPAVSGSSGHLIIQNRDPQKKDWPGRVFQEVGLSYEAAMLEFVAASESRGRRPSSEDHAEDHSTDGSARAVRRTLKLEQAQLRQERGQIREQRKLEDLVWKRVRGKRKEETLEGLIEPNGEQWQALLAQRRSITEKRKAEDELWRQKRLSLREGLSKLPVVNAWIAILVIVDNCSRQCSGLPLFLAGAKVTSEMVVEALRALLPLELQFLISDRGLHFNSKAFEKLALSQDFIHVLITRHRPQSNGIAERFVRTLKEWLADQSWTDDEELATLLERFLDEYNDRPHQGLPVPGLSPNEFSRRISNR